jgi:sigma-E factor negative regulatory protein RseC
MVEVEVSIARLEGDLAWVESQRSSACGHCSSGASCGTRLFSSVFGAKPVQIAVPNSLGGRVGECFVLGLPEQTMVLGSLRLYLLPLLGLILGAVAGERLALVVPGFGELWSIALGLLGLILLPWAMNRARPDTLAQEAVLLRRVQTAASHFVPLNIPNKESI